MKKIKLTKNKFAIVDDDLYGLLNSYKWYALSHHCKGKFYARRVTNKKLGEGGQKWISMHHCIIGYPLKKMQIDHINGDSLDNRRNNLRIVTARENSQNLKCHRLGNKTSKYIGVSRIRHGGWMAQLWLNGTNKYIGYYDSEFKAKNAYDNYKNTLTKGEST